MSSNTQKNEQTAKVDPYSQEELDEISTMLAKPIKKVSVQAKVLFRIIQHHNHSNVSRDSETIEKKFKSVRGQLLGLPNNGVLEVTNSFALPPKDDQSAESYQNNMATLLAKSENSDTHNVGWYQSTSLNSFMNADTIYTQYQYQRDFQSRCICLVYDPVRSKKDGTSWLKAYRLSDVFMNLIRKAAPQEKDPMKKLELDIYNDGLPEDFPKITIQHIQETQLKHDQIFEEIEIEILNEALSAVLTHDMKKLLKPSFKSLDLSNIGYLEKQLQHVLDNYDDMSQEQSNLWTKMRNRSESLPNRLDNLLLSAQIQKYTEEIGKENAKNISVANLGKGIIIGNQSK